MASELFLERIKSNHEVNTFLFFDQVNTCRITIGLIKEILCDRRIDGIQIPTPVHRCLQSLSDHTPEMIIKLFSFRLGMITGDKMEREH